MGPNAAITATPFREKELWASVPGRMLEARESRILRPLKLPLFAHCANSFSSFSVLKISVPRLQKRFFILRLTRGVLR